MLVIRLQRIGKKKQAAFRVVLQEHTWKPQGKTQELLGFYNPRTKEKMFQAERVKYWISRGAKVSPTVHNLLVDEKIIEGPKIKAWRPKKKVEAEKSAEQKTVEADKRGSSEVAPAAEPTPAAAPEPGSETSSPSESVASAATGSSTTGEPEKEPAKTEA